MSRAIKKSEPILLEAERDSVTGITAEPETFEVRRIDTFVGPLHLDQSREALILFSVLFIVAIGGFFCLFLY